MDITTHNTPNFPDQIERFFSIERAKQRLSGFKDRIKQTREARSGNIGLSTCVNLHAQPPNAETPVSYKKAALCINLYRNGEANVYTSAPMDKKWHDPDIEYIKDKAWELRDRPELLDRVLDRFGPGAKTGRKEGDLMQDGLSGHARRSLRVISDQYQKMVTDDGWVRDAGNRSHCAFITLTYRRILPKSTVQAKQMLRAMLQRMYRYKGRDFHYCWVGEMQRGKRLSGEDSYRKKEMQSVIHFHILTPEYFPMEWINKAWNEVVAGAMLRHGQITPISYGQWMNEYDNWSAWLVTKKEWNAADSKVRGKAPRSPGVGQYMLMPNVTAVFHSGRYMAKYISKDGKDLQGHLWAASTMSRALAKPIKTRKEFATTGVCDLFVSALKEQLEGREVAVFDYQNIPDFYGDNAGFWTSEGFLLMEIYYDISASHSINTFNGVGRRRSRTREPVPI